MWKFLEEKAQDNKVIDRELRGNFNIKTNSFVIFGG